jgi:hypothetical protein
MDSGLSLGGGIVALAIVFTGQFSRGLLLQLSGDQQEGSKVYRRLGLFGCHSDKFHEVMSSVATII